MKTEIYLTLFKNKITGAKILVASGDIYDTFSYDFLKYEVEYKDLADKCFLNNEWEFEQKTKEITWE